MENLGKHIAFIPLRAGSKSIPGKNFRNLGGKPLFCHAVDACLSSKVFNKIVVATNSSNVIALCNERYSNHPTIFLYEREQVNAQDNSSTESVMLEFSHKFDFDIITLVQATSPLTKASDFVQAMKLLNQNKFDSILSVVNERRFYWRTTIENGAQPINYVPKSRPRRQEIEGAFVENGALYVTRRSSLIESQCRLSGKIGLYKMSNETAFEIDEPEDLVIIEQLLKRSHAKEGVDFLEKI